MLLDTYVTGDARGKREASSGHHDSREAICGHDPSGERKDERDFAILFPYPTQVAPGIPENQKRPQSMTLPEWGFTWYQNLTYGLNVSQNPFFYGNYLGPTKKKEPVRRSKAESYQCDSIGALGGLQEDHFQKMHRYRLEWEPGDGGYLRWYIDGKFKFGIEQSSLSAAMGTQIPQEPSYLIFNTAISTSWGFPEPPPGCDKYDCKTAEGRCGMSEGFCRSLPAVFSIDHVRVYQYKRNSSSSGVNGTAVPSFHHSVGCNPPSFPTRRFIQANEDKYRNAKDTHPLRQVVTGTGKCQGNGQCGEGKCLHGACMCAEGWQGPRCLVRDKISCHVLLGNAHDEALSRPHCYALTDAHRCPLIGMTSQTGTRKCTGCPPCGLHC